MADRAAGGRVRLLRSAAERPCNLRLPVLDVLLLWHCRELLLQLLPPPVRICISKENYVTHDG